MTSTKSIELGVAIPTYRRQDQLANLLASIPDDVAIFVSDNGATLTPEFIEHHRRARITSSAEVVPMFRNWNRAARLATTEWVIVPSDDDIYFEHSFPTIRQVLSRFPDADVIVFGHHVVGKQYEVLSSWCPDVLRVCEAPHGFSTFTFGVDARMPAIVFRRSMLETLGYFDETFRLTASDSDLVHRSLLTGKSVFVPEVVAGYRVWPEGATNHTLATQDWLREVDVWGGKLELALLLVPEFATRASKIRSELYALNLLAGMTHLRKKGNARGALTHFRQSAYPRRARPSTQLRLLYAWLRSNWQTGRVNSRDAGPT